MNVWCLHLVDRRKILPQCQTTWDDVLVDPWYLVHTFHRSDIVLSLGDG